MSANSCLFLFFLLFETNTTRVKIITRYTDIVTPLSATEAIHFRILMNGRCCFHAQCFFMQNFGKDWGDSIWILDLPEAQERDESKRKTMFVSIYIFMGA